MPYLRSDSPFDHTPATNLLTRNPFLIFRLVLLALLGNLAFLSLIFASWNINVSLSASLSAPSTSVFVIFESCLFFICVTLALAEFFLPKGKISYTVVECSWVGVVSLFQTGAAISSTINGPAIACHSSGPDWAVCASALLLVPSTWLSSILSLAYFFALFVTIMAHRNLYPDIWKRTIYTIEWFEHPQNCSSKEKIVQDFLRGCPSDDSTHNAYYEDIESTAGRMKPYAIRNSIEEATPCAPINVRRGIDHPFTRPQGSNSNISSPVQRTSNLALPSLPDRSATIGTAGSRYLEKFRESTVLSRPESPRQFTKHYHSHNGSFALSVADLDKPIPLPRLSEWIRADSAL